MIWSTVFYMSFNNDKEKPLGVAIVSKLNFNNHLDERFKKLI